MVEGTSKKPLMFSFFIFKTLFTCWFIDDFDVIGLKSDYSFVDKVLLGLRFKLVSKAPDGCGCKLPT